MFQPDENSRNKLVLDKLIKINESTYSVKMRMTAPAHFDSDMGYPLVSGHLFFTFSSNCRKTGVGSGTAEIGGATGIPGVVVTPSDFISH